jgi:hypothetical protein
VIREIVIEGGEGGRGAGAESDGEGLGSERRPEAGVIVAMGSECKIPPT